MRTKAIKILKNRAVIVLLSIGLGAATGGTLNPATVQAIAGAAVAVLEVTDDQAAACDE